MALTGDQMLAEVCSAAGLGELHDFETASGSFAIKQLMDINAERAETQLDLLSKLAAHGLPVPVPHSSGVQTLGNMSFIIFPWVRGKHLSSPEMSLAQCVELGSLLREVHEALASLLPPPGEATLLNQDPSDTLRYTEKLLNMIDARPEPDEIDAIARANLTWRQRLVPEISHLRPQGSVCGPPGWTHGDFHHNNILWHNGSVSAIVDWDRVKVVRNQRMLRWWTAHRAEVASAFSGVPE